MSRAKIKYSEEFQLSEMRTRRVMIFTATHPRTLMLKGYTSMYQCPTQFVDVIASLPRSAGNDLAIINQIGEQPAEFST